MKHQDLIKYKLETIPQFRERSRKNIGLATLVAQEHGFKLRKDERFIEVYESHNGLVIPKEMFVNMLTMYATMDRAWRKILKENPHLRGTDYREKTKLETKAKQELGYEEKD